MFKLECGQGIDLDEWAEFVAVCFSDKQPPPPKELFKQKLVNDPSFSPEHDIRVFRDEGGSLVATLRFFRDRRIREDAETVEAIGIGEVCVRRDQRGKGLARSLVAESVERERGARQGKENDGIRPQDPAMFLLHASLPNARELYAKCGFRSCPHAIEYVHMFPPLSSVGDTQHGITIRLVDPLSKVDIETLSELYNHNQPRGTFARSLSYWHCWVMSKWKHRNAKAYFVYSSSFENADIPIGYMCLFPSERKLRLDEVVFRKDFAFDLVKNQAYLLALAGARLYCAANGTPANNDVVEVIINKAFLDHYDEPGNPNVLSPKINITVDEGWMYSYGSDFTEVSTSIPLASSGVFFDADGF